MCCLGENGGSWKGQAEQQEGQEGPLPGCDGVKDTVEEGEETDEAEVAGKELGLGDILVSGASGLLAGLVSLGIEVLLVDVAGVLFCVTRRCTACDFVGLPWVTTTERKAQVDQGWQGNRGRQRSWAIPRQKPQGMSGGKKGRTGPTESYWARGRNGPMSAPKKVWGKNWA
ncbi:hypothetical protein llap_11824 [Limosa lapponica baueri]|uniref:Uncharacterized protein n=1 Tax=Limosa lapponica baueri TaxID=1758121 RepID=A0A2I0TVN9_LIMLA|nr:hypothetical protein llap_11824 [Limosa lapponica baueri]